MNLGNRYSQRSFAEIPSVHTPRSVFNRSFATKDTLDFDYLNPVFVDEVLPGDTVVLNAQVFARLATQVVPVLDRMYMDFYFFFVPNRLVWEHWEEFCGEQKNPGDSTDYLIPTVTNTGNAFEVGSIYDKFGLPNVSGISVNALPFRAYNLIFNEWFRDQNLQDRLDVPKGDGPDAPSTYKLVKKAKLHDYFTSALPFPQKGAAVMLPLGDKAPVYGNQLRLDDGDIVAGGTKWQGYGAFGALSDQFDIVLPSGEVVSRGKTALPWEAFSLATEDQYTYPWEPPYADLSQATQVTMNLFRQAILMQSLLELDARGGTRYVEILRAHFNVVSPDFRLQRPEFLSGGTVQITQHPVPQTSASMEQSPQASLASFATAAEFGDKIGFSKSFVEHGYIIGLAVARGEVTYQGGINRMWLRETRWDFFWPKLQELGEQAIYKAEIYPEGTPDDKEPWGYQERYAEYRYRPSEIKGQFRSSYSESLDVWHLSEEFDNAPVLNDEFIQLNTPIERSLAVTEGYPHLLCDFFFEYKHVRPMMTYGIPATLGRF